MRIGLLLTLALIPLLASAQGPARNGLQKFGTGLESLQARFNQTVTNQDGSRENAGDGEVWLKKPGLFRWSLEGEFPELIVADGDRVWLYDQVLEQVTVKAQSGLAENTPLLLLTNPEALDEQFEVREAGQYDGINLLELVSRSPESEFERVLLGFRNDQLFMMTLEDAFGMRTEIRFSGIDRNPELDEGLFLFEPPNHVDVVGDVADDPSQ